MIKLDSKSFMMIEPQKQKTEPLSDELVKKAKLIKQSLKTESYMTKGFHICKCGECSDNRIYKTLIGRETNSLLVHYVKCHREEIPESELKKLEEEYQAVMEYTV